MMKSKSGMGMGEGRGSGDRPEEETDTNSYESKVAGKVRKGEAVATGSFAGPNKAGPSREALHEQIMSEVSKQSDPLTDQRLPRAQRQHTNQYMKILREGK